MTPEQIAQGCVKHGVLHRVGDVYYIEWDGYRGISVGWAEEASNDGRVVLAMMEKCLANGIDLNLSLQSNYFEAPGFWITGTLMELSADIEIETDGREPLGPAIIEACLQALGGENRSGDHVCVGNLQDALDQAQAEIERLEELVQFEKQVGYEMADMAERAEAENEKLQARITVLEAGQQRIIGDKGGRSGNQRKRNIARDTLLAAAEDDDG